MNKLIFKLLVALGFRCECGGKLVDSNNGWHELVCTGCGREEKC